MEGTVQTVLFDMDGVLVDSFEAWYAVVNHTARHFGAPPIDRVRLAEIFGQGPEDDAKTLYPGSSVAEIRAVYDEVMPAQVARVQVGPDSHRVLDDLRRRGLQTAVVTNTQVSLAHRILEATHLLGRLDAWAGVGEGLREKPAPDLLDRVLGQLGAAPDGAVLVGDTRYDEEAARALDIPFVLFDLRRGKQTLAEALSPHLP